MIWYVHRRGDNSIASTYAELQPGLAEETLDDKSPELAAYFQAGQAPDPANADNLAKALKAVLLAAAIMSGKTLAQAKSAFLNAWQALP